MGAMAIALLVYSVVCALADKVETHLGNQPIIHFSQPNLTIKADRVPIGFLLEKIAMETGISFVLKGPADQPVSVSLTAISVEKAIGRLFSGANIAMTYKTNPDGKSVRLTDVFVVMDAGANTQYKFAANSEVSAQEVMSESEEGEDPAAVELCESPEPRNVSQIKAMLLRERNPEARAAVIQLMGNIRGDQVESATELLMAAMRDKHPGVRVAALTSLSAMPEEMAASGMLQAMNDPAPEVRAAAFRIVGSLPLISPVDLLDRGLKDKDTRVRAVSIEAAAKTESAKVLPLLATATKDGDASVRKAALQAIAELEGNGSEGEATNDATVEGSGK